jgi:hypothetical protein
VHAKLPLKLIQTETGLFGHGTALAVLGAQLRVL